MTSSSELLARCPSCHYDLQGAVAAWSDACPREGICPECGHHFEWSKILKRRGEIPSWCVESVTGVHRVLRRVPSTVAMTFRPWRFWSPMHVDQPVRWKPLILYLIVLLLLLHGIFSIGAGVLAYRRVTRFNTGRLIQHPGSALTVAYAMVAPWSRTPLHQIAARFDVRVPRHSPPGKILRLPRQSKQAFVYVHRKLMMTSHYTSPRRNNSAYLGIVVAHILMVMVIPLGLVAFPGWCRRARIRLAHVVRVTFYSFALLLPEILLLAVLVNLSAWLETQIPRAAWWLFTLFVPVCLAVWWTKAAKHYFKMPDALGLGLALTLIAVPVTLVPILTFMYVTGK